MADHWEPNQEEEPSSGWGGPAADLRARADAQAALLQLFPGAPFESIRAFVRLGHVVEVPADGLLCTRDFTPLGLTVILSGTVSVEQDGHRIVDIGRGGYYGEGVLVRDDTPIVTLRCAEPSRCIIFPRALTRRFFHEHYAFGMAVTMVLLAESMRRLSNTNRLFADNRTLALKLQRAHDQIETEIRDRIATEEKATYFASHDPLTGLANRKALRERVAALIPQARRAGRRFAVLSLDLDGFKEINDLHGHAVGDKALEMVATRLRDATRQNDLIARLGGDEFAIIQDLSHLALDEDSEPGVSRFIDRMLDVCRDPFHIDGVVCQISASVGAAVYPADGVEADDLLRNADLALARAKRDGGAQGQFFAPRMSEEIARISFLRSELRRAAARGELSLDYQPKVNLSNGRIVGMEALMRWRHSECGLISPAEFIPVAEQHGLILSLGEWLVEESSRAARRFHDEGFPAVRMAINISPAQLRRQNVRRLLLDALAAVHLPPAAMEVEITEGVLLNDAAAVEASLRRLRDDGFGVAVDDFGTGYSSLSYLKRLSATCVKIDRAFVKGLHHSAEDQSIARAIITLAHSLGMEVVAEGVENDDQLRFLRRLRADTAQGYGLCRPLPFDDVLMVLQRCLVRETHAVLLPDIVGLEPRPLF